MTVHIRRSHFTAPAFPQPKSFTRANGSLRIALRLLDATPYGHRYRLELYNPKVPASQREIAICALTEDRTGKWYVEHAGAGCSMPPAARAHLDRFVAELDAASRGEFIGKSAGTPTRKAPKKKRAKKTRAKKPPTWDEARRRYERTRKRAENAWDRAASGRHTGTYAEATARARALDEQAAAEMEAFYAAEKRRTAEQERAILARERERYARGEIGPTGQRIHKRAVIEDQGGQLAMFGQTEMFP